MHIASKQIPLLGNSEYPKETVAFIQKETCLWIFMATLFITAKNWRVAQLCTDRRINRLLYIDIIEHNIAARIQWTIITHINVDEYQKSWETSQRKHTLWYLLFKVQNRNISRNKNNILFKDISLSDKIIQAME